MSVGWIRRLSTFGLLAVALPGVEARGQGLPPPPRERAVFAVNQALAQQAKGQFAVARLSLERALTECGSEPEGRECRAIVASGLGSLLQHEAVRDRSNSELLYRTAVGYYDQVLDEIPDHPEALYGKALAYRSLGAHEWQESFFQRAPELDPSQRTMYLSFQGDYYSGRRLWAQAVDAYRRAVDLDADDDGARSGLIEALGALGAVGVAELLRRAGEWELRYPESAAQAYGAALTDAFSPAGGRPDTVAAGRALVGLVSVQARSGRALAVLPPAVPLGWSPIRELRAFLEYGGADIAWWRAGVEREVALAQAALARGRQAASEGELARAERNWRNGLHVVPGLSPVRLDLQRELAMLYFREPELDLNGAKLRALEHEIFTGKGGALAAGDLEAAQRYHTALGLIYAQRGVWRRTFARSADQQLTWALAKADERRQQEGFYQPLPELKRLLAWGLDSIGERGNARALYLEASSAYLDADDLAAAADMVRKAARLRPGADLDERNRLIQFRSEVAQSDPGAAGACVLERLRTLWRAGPVDFALRQRFKVLADCARLGSAGTRRANAIEAFRVADSGRVTLVGAADVARYERILATLLGPVGLIARAAHLDRAPPTSGPEIPVSLPAQTRPLWLGAALDDVVAARVVTALDPHVRVSRIQVTDGVVTLYVTAEVPAPILERLRRLRGVRVVRVVMSVG